MKLRKWVQVLLLILYVLGMIGMICIEVNLLLAIIGMALCGTSLYLLDKYGTILDFLNID